MIKAQHSEIDFFIKDPDLFNFDLYAKNSKIILGASSSKLPFQQKTE